MRETVSKDAFNSLFYSIKCERVFNVNEPYFGFDKKYLHHS